MTYKEKYQLLPELPPEQFEALKADIAERGVVVPVVVDEFGAILDGHNRARACRELGINDYPVEVRSGLSEEEKRVFARKLNVLRRHLSRDQVRDLIAEQLKETPAWANNRIAGALGVDDKTVATVRAGLEATSELPKLDKLVGADGKERPVKRPRNGRRSRSVAGDDWDDDWDERADKNWKKNDPWNDPVRIAKMQHAVDLIEIGADPNEEKVQRLIREFSVCTISDHDYDMFAGRSDAEKLEWCVFTAFLSYDGDAGRDGFAPENACYHVEWVLQRPFQNVAEWLGEEGDKFRRRCVSVTPTMSDQLKADWAAFRDAHRDCTLADVEAELKSLLERFEQARDAGLIHTSKPSRMATVVSARHR